MWAPYGGLSLPEWRKSLVLQVGWSQGSEGCECGAWVVSGGMGCCWVLRKGKRITDTTGINTSRSSEYSRKLKNTLAEGTSLLTTREIQLLPHSYVNNIIRCVGSIWGFFVLVWFVVCFSMHIINYSLRWDRSIFSSVNTLQYFLLISFHV